jgi:hypothetical protein
MFQRNLAFSILELIFIFEEASSQIFGMHFTYLWTALNTPSFSMTSSVSAVNIPLDCSKHPLLLDDVLGLP